MDIQETHCKQAPGTMRPVIDRNRCEGKKECVAVCPYNVFTIATVAPEMRRAPPPPGRAQGLPPPLAQAVAADPRARPARGGCGFACPEKAIVLVRFS